MQLTQSAAEKILADMQMDDMPLTQLRPTPHPVAPDWFTKYRAAARSFMQSLTDSVEELAFMNLNQDEFLALVMGSALPRNMSLRMRLPLVWGGTLTPDNFFICSTFPHSQNLDRFIINQAGAETIWMPAPAKKIYIPAHTANGGAGGNATEDRLAQMAAQLAAGNTME